MKKIGIVLLVFGVAAPAFAGDLLTTGTAYNGPDEILGGAAKDWRGSALVTDFVLTATVEYCVYAPGDFPFTGYTPTPGEFTYCYQVYTDVASAYEVNLFYVNMLESNEANNIGTLSLSDSDLDADTASFAGSVPNLGSADWTFDGLAQGEASFGLAFSSINAPTAGYGFIQDGGHTGVPFMEMPAPSDVIPEPATLSLLAVGLLAVRRRK